MTDRLDIDGVVREVARATFRDGVVAWDDRNAGDAAAAGDERAGTHESAVHRVGPNEWRVRWRERTLRVWTARTDEGTWVSWEGRTRLVRDATREARRRGGAGASPGAGDRVTPPTPATVVNVLVAPGATVAAGAPLVVVSAMKMETTLTAPHAGRVVSVDTEVGARVMPGDELVAIEVDAGEVDAGEVDAGEVDAGDGGG